MTLPRSICVYCGSNRGRSASYAELARRLGEELARRGIRLVYGGGRVGLMGILADAVLAGGGEVLGVIPGALDRREVGHRGLTERVVVTTMHERKRTMFERSEAFIALPGGFGTFDEIIEMITWRQLTMHFRPVILLNHAGYFDGLLAQIRRGVEEGFIAAPHAAIPYAARDVAGCFEYLGAFESPEVPDHQRWF
ncbi:MAG: TIGR00730 family Rossman fold protein [Myxococcales bacterium]|nr:TIGR00730 family Rossman fold protein [Myxococcales bacterium]